jgi:antitoxin HigA-1
MSTRIHNPSHPGAILREYFPEGVTVTSAATGRHCSRVILSRILNGRAGVTVDMAVRLSDYLGKSAEFWLNLQVQPTLWHARKAKLAKVKPLARTIATA